MKKRKSTKYIQKLNSLDPTRPLPKMNNPDLTTDLVFAFNRECRPMLRETVLVAACLALKDATAEA